MAYTGSKAFQPIGTKLQVGDGASAEQFTTVAEITNVQRSGSKADYADTTNMDSTSAYREFLPTLLDAGEISYSGNYIPSDATQANMQSLFDNRTLSNWKIVLPDSTLVSSETVPGSWSFKAYVTGFDFDLSHDKQATMSGKLKITGKPTFNSAT